MILMSSTIRSCRTLLSDAQQTSTPRIMLSNYAIQRSPRAGTPPLIADVGLESQTDLARRNGPDAGESMTQAPDLMRLPARTCGDAQKHANYA